jgi:hypothetical protein
LEAYLAKEAQRLMMEKRDKEIEKEREERYERERAEMSQRLATWNDDREEELATEEYYADRSRWRKKRQEIRLREQEMDDRARQREEPLSTSIITMMEGIERTGRDRGSVDGQAASLASGQPIRLSLSTTKRPNPTAVVGEVGMGADEPGEAEDVRKRRRLAPPPPVPRVEDPEERRQMIERLVARIPADPNALWRWEIQWDYLTKVCKQHAFIDFN